MLKTVVFWLLLQPFMFTNPGPGEAVNCPPASNLHKTVATSNSYSIAWSSVGEATQYKVWYVRLADGFVGTAAFTTGKAHTFTSLTPGRYVFYVATVCGSETSGFIGIEDILET